MDEQEIANAIEVECGSAQKAERLNYIWRKTLGRDDRLSAFTKAATKERYSLKAIQLFLMG